MGSISGFGTGFAVLISVLATSASVQAADDVSLRLTLSGMRSAKGQVLVCVTSNAKAFPDCSKDKSARRLAVPAGKAGEIDIAGLVPGIWAVSLIHDENANGKMDMALVMPKEGFGFSRNPKIGFGPPKFKNSAVQLVAGDNRQSVKLSYIL